MFEAVEDEEARAAGCEGMAQHLDRIPRVEEHLEGPGDGPRDLVDRPGAGDVAEVQASGPRVDPRLEVVEHHAGLPDPSRTEHGHETRALQQLVEQAELGATSDAPRGGPDPGGRPGRSGR